MRTDRPDVEPGTCTICLGAKSGLAFVNRGDAGCTTEMLPCRECKGEGTITRERADALNQARRRAADRINRGVSLREEADRLGMTPVELSRLEHP